LGTPYYLRNGKSYGFQIWPVHLEGPSEQKPIKNFRENGVWAYPGTAQFFRIPPIISGTDKATSFKFCMYIYRLNRSKSPLKNLRKVAMSVVRDPRKFSGHPYLGRIARSSLRQLSFLVTLFIYLFYILRHRWVLYALASFIVLIVSFMRTAWSRPIPVKFLNINIILLLHDYII